MLFERIFTKRVRQWSILKTIQYKIMITALRQFRAFPLFLLLCCTQAPAFPTRPFSAGVGFGVPEFTFVEAQVAAFGRCQLGASFGALPIPGLLPQNIPLDTQTVSLSTGDVFTLQPKVTPSFYLLSPFIRVFPSKNNNFYLQLMWSMLRLTATITGDMTPRDNPVLPTVPVTGTVLITQAMPTFSVGYLFSTRIFYFNLAIGVARMMSPTTTTSISAAIPNSLGGNSTNEVQLDGINSDIQSSVATASAEVRSTYGYFPSLHLSFGFYF
jgi:hypothetical protein